MPRIQFPFDVFLGKGFPHRFGVFKSSLRSLSKSTTREAHTGCCGVLITPSHRCRCWYSLFQLPFSPRVPPHANDKLTAPRSFHRQPHGRPFLRLSERAHILPYESGTHLLNRLPAFSGYRSNKVVTCGNRRATQGENFRRDRSYVRIRCFSGYSDGLFMGPWVRRPYDGLKGGGDTGGHAHPAAGWRAWCSASFAWLWAIYGFRRCICFGWRRPPECSGSS